VGGVHVYSRHTGLMRTCPYLVFSCIHMYIKLNLSFFKQLWNEHSFDNIHRIIHVTNFKHKWILSSTIEKYLPLNINEHQSLEITWNGWWFETHISFTVHYAAWLAYCVLINNAYLYLTQVMGSNRASNQSALLCYQIF